MKARSCLDIDRARLEVQRHDGEHIKVDVGADAGEYYGGGPPDNFTDIVAGKEVTNWAPDGLECAQSR